MDAILSQCKNAAAAEAIREHQGRVARLIDQGVVIPCPHAVEIEGDVDLDRIAPGVVLHSGSRLRGPRTLLAPGVVVGREGPASVQNTVAGHGAQLDGGSYTETTFLDHAESRSWSHMRAGCLLEEHARVAHCVGIKQTILFPWVTLGSLINFCDVLMAGGTGNNDHSEVGSGYIHFNFTPRGDKATPSIYGDVPSGVLLNRPRIFLGGLAATVGPMSVGYGSFLGPGEVYRRDVREGRFLLGERKPRMNIDYEPRLLTGLRGKMKKNLTFLGNLIALRRWYLDVRPQLTGSDPWRAQVIGAGQEAVNMAIAERIKQLGRLIDRVPESITLLEAAGSHRLAGEQQLLIDRWPSLKEALEQCLEMGGDDGPERAQVMNAAARGSGPYVEVVQSFDEATRQAATTWLSEVVTGVVAAGQAALNAD